MKELPQRYTDVFIVAIGLLPLALVLSKTALDRAMR